MAAYYLALQERTREHVPLDWAATQNNLGTALLMLGERESGTTRLGEAVTAFRAALAEWTRERVPPDWAGTQRNLGTALLRWGERERDTARLEEAVLAFDAGLEIFNAAGRSHHEVACREIQRGCVRFWTGGRVSSEVDPIGWTGIGLS